MPALKFLVWAFLLVSLCWTNFLSAKPFGGVSTDEAFASRINAFGCNLLEGLYEKSGNEENILISPINAYTALSLLYLGAEDVTAKQLATVMKVTDFENSTEVHERLHKIVSKLAPKSENAYEKFHETVLASGLFVQNDYTIKESYIQAVKKFYDSEVKNVDFSGHPKETTEEINQFIARSTHDRIPHFYESPLDSQTVAVLASALYFNAKWFNEFPMKNTQNEKFNTGVGEIEVPMMSMETDLYYVNDDTYHYESVSLPYSGKEYEMTIYLQHTQHGDHGSLANLFHQLTEHKFYTKSASRSLVHIKLPKMKFSWKKSVVNALKLEDVFKSAHLDEMTPNPVKITDMLHATELEVDEEGTIASAATGVEMVPLSGFVPANKEPIMFHVDRPFLMTILHKPTQTLLFGGIVRKPYYYSEGR